MTRAALLALSLVLVAGQACAPKSQAQSPADCDAALSALRLLYTRAASDVINAGACDHVSRIEQCEAYRIIETQYDLVARAACPSKQ